MFFWHSCPNLMPFSLFFVKLQCVSDGRSTDGLFASACMFFQGEVGEMRVHKDRKLRQLLGYAN